MFPLNERFGISLPSMIEWMLYYIDISVDIIRKVLLLFNEQYLVGRYTLVVQHVA